MIVFKTNVTNLEILLLPIRIIKNIRIIDQSISVITYKLFFNQFFDYCLKFK